MHTTIAGEVRFVLSDSDGTVKTDTGFRNNLILDQGLDFFGGGNGGTFASYCLIGSGNSAPRATQNTLDGYISHMTGSMVSEKHDYVDDGSDTYKLNQTFKYRFTGLNNVNIAEVGLASAFSSSTNYYLCTRALIKDSSGSPMAISVKADETLDVYYRVWMVLSTTDTEHEIMLHDGAGGSTAYKAICRLSHVGSSTYTMQGYGMGGAFELSDGRFDWNGGTTFSGELGGITGQPTTAISGGTSRSLSAYVKGSYKRQGTTEYALNSSNGSIRCVDFGSTLGGWQVRYGSIVGDNPIIKTNKDKLSIPLEFSWGRYEGVLE